MISENAFDEIMENKKTKKNTEKFVIRLADDDAKMLESAVNWFVTQGDVRYAVREVGRKCGQLHIHVLITPFKIKTTFVQNFHKFFKKRWEGNESFSCKQQRKDDFNNYVYLSKGPSRFEQPIVLYKGAITDEQVFEWWQHYWSDKPIEEDNTIKVTEDGKVVVKNKKKNPTWSQMLTARIRKNMDGFHWEYSPTCVAILLDDFVMPALGEESKKLSPLIVRDLVLGQLNALCGGKCVSLNKKIRREGFPDLFGNGEHDFW